MPIKRLGITYREPLEKPLQLGDSRTVNPVGLATGLSIRIVLSESYKMSAVCLDVFQLRFDYWPCCFPEMHIGTDWQCHFWWICTAHGIMPLDVRYTALPSKKHMNRDAKDHDEQETENVESDVEDAFLLLTTPDDEEVPNPTNDSIDPKTQGNRLGDLRERVQDHPVLLDDEKIA